MSVEDRGNDVVLNVPDNMIVDEFLPLKREMTPGPASTPVVDSILDLLRHSQANQILN
jgi:hypothetical protein